MCVTASVLQRLSMYQHLSLFCALLWCSCYIFGASGQTKCNSDLKVYVYDISPQLLERAEAARKNGDYHICKKCIYEQFSLEYIVYDYFTQHCGRTSNPDEADYFYLPIVREIDYRIALSNGGQRAPSIIEEALIDAVEKNDLQKWGSVFNVTDKYWQRGNGSDHIIVMPAPVTNFRHQTNMRGFFHYMIHLTAPIYLNVEYSRSFVDEYPVCAKEKNIIMPYPTVDPDFYSGNLFQSKLQRDKLIFYLGGNHGSCVFVRDALTGLSRVKQIAIQRGPRKREEGFQSAVFCPIPIGDSPSSKRMYDVVNYGCIPVVLSDDLVWAYSTQAGGPLDPSTFSIQLPQSTVLKTAQHVLDALGATSGSVGSAGAEKPKGKAKASLVNKQYLLNYGRPLPGGVSVLTLLQEIAEEDRLAATELASSADNSTSGASIIARSRSRRLSAEALSTDELVLLRASNRYLLQVEEDEPVEGAKPAWAGKGPNKGKNNKNKATGDATAKVPVSSARDKKVASKANNRAAASTDGSAEGMSNTLIRLLQKVSAQDIARLQEGVRNVSKYFQFYALNTTLRTDVTPPAVHMYPSGGAMEMLEHALVQRKKTGILNIHSRCQAERTRPGHKYIGNYPCEKRK